MNAYNLILQFLLEFGALIAIGAWSWNYFEDWKKYFFTILLLILIMAVWGMFTVPNDPSRAKDGMFKVNGIIRLLIELSVFLFGIKALLNIGFANIAFVFSFLVLGHYIVSWRRVNWLILN
jgi:hypothetical protein